jgi:beta-glucosidase/6-phospho-beta-glucosidase/beta-galactosidase
LNEKGEIELNFLSGFESTHIFGSGRDVLQTTNHTELYEQDLQLAKQSGLDLMRYSAPWHSIEQTQGVYDWSWMDGAMNCLKKIKIQPILDPLHHTSFPVWLSDGFADRRFVDSYVRFVTALARRYPWARHYTIINEPFVTAFFCGHEGIWHPHFRGGENFVTMIINMGEAICRISRMLVKTIPNVQLIHVDTCEKHRAMDAESIAETAFRNELRFLVHDLILGKINEKHRLYGYLRENGASETKLRRFVESPTRIDVLGLDYYAHSELEWKENGQTRVYPNEQPEGFAVVAEDYVERYRLPVMLSETNIRGAISDRVSWLKFMVEQCEILKTNLEPRGVPFLGFCWYPFVDSTDWCSLVREANCTVDPQGIFCLDDVCRARNASELSEIFAALAGGEITAKNIPAYQFQAPLDETLRNFLPLMRDWEWIEPLGIQ